MSTSLSYISAAALITLTERSNIYSFKAVVSPRLSISIVALSATTLRPLPAFSDPVLILVVPSLCLGIALKFKAAVDAANNELLPSLGSTPACADLPVKCASNLVVAKKSVVDKETVPTGNFLIPKCKEKK